MKYKYDIEELKKVTKNSNSFTEVLRTLKIPQNGGNQMTLKKVINLNNINVSHFYVLSLEYPTRKLKSLTKEQVLDKFRIYNIEEPISFSEIKRLCIKHNFIDYKCSECENVGEWKNKTLVLQLDHVNGNKLNNELSNLRFLCPNCHSQTETFSGKHKNKKLNENLIYEQFISSNNKRQFFRDLKSQTSAREINRLREFIRSKIKSTELITEKTIQSSKNKSKEWIEKIAISNRKVKDRPTKEKLNELIKSESFVSIGKLYGVSDNSIRKWCKRYSLI